MASDIMAENQTEQVLSVLDRGEADDKTMQSVSSAILRCLQKFDNELADIKSRLWKKDDLETMIDARHKLHCDNCPARKYVERATAVVPVHPDQKKTKSWWAELLTSESLRYFILVLVLVWTVVVMKTSTDEAAAVMENVKTTITGGMK